MNELYHYARKGQKWGVRNGPPYPLNRETVSRVYGKHGSSGIDAVFIDSNYNSQSKRDQAKLKKGVDHLVKDYYRANGPVSYERMRKVQEKAVSKFMNQFKDMGFDKVDVKFLVEDRGRGSQYRVDIKNGEEFVVRFLSYAYPSAMIMPGSSGIRTYRIPNKVPDDLLDRNDYFRRLYR